MPKETENLNSLTCLKKLNKYLKIFSHRKLSITGEFYVIFIGGEIQHCVSLFRNKEGMLSIRESEAHTRRENDMQIYL